MKKIFLGLIALAFSVTGRLWAQAPGTATTTTAATDKAPTSTSTAPSAETILKEAYQRAAKEKKNVMIIFHASWCGWCHKMDTAMNDVACKKFFTDNYVVEHLTVL